MFRHRPAWALLLLLAAPRLAWADPKDDARRAFLAGLEAAEAQDYETAVERFLAAQASYPHPSTAFNIGRAYRDMGDHEQALRWFRTFATLDPGRADQVAGEIAALEAHRVAAPVVTTRAPVGAVASSVELDALRKMADELQALATALATRTPTDAAPTETDAGEADAGEAPAEPTPATPVADTTRGGFITDAYDRVVTSATRSGQDPLDSPSTISVLTAEDIRLSGATSIPELLRRIPGVETMSLTAAHTAVGIRGHNRELSNKVLWLIDGRSVYWDFLASPLQLNQPISLEEIERIEVIRGPGSAIYGANAMTGVVNIITRAPGEGPSQTIKFATGLPDFVQATALTSGRVAGIGYRMSAGFDQEGRWEKDLEIPEGSAVVPFRDDQDLAARRVRANGRLDARFLDKGFASISGGYTNGFQEFLNLGLLGESVIEGSTHYVRGDLAYGPIHLRSFWNHEEGATGKWLDQAGDPYKISSDLQSDVGDVELEGNGSVNTGEVRHQLNAGVSYRFKRIKFGLVQGGFDAPRSEHHFGGFLQEQLTWKWFSAVASLRVDRHPLVPIAETISPRGALIFRVAPRTAVRVSGGTAYRAMSGLESYVDFALAAGADGAYIRDYGGEVAPVNSGLVPERIVTVELGVHDESSVYHSLDAAFYWNRLTDQIELDSVTPTLSPYDPEFNGYQVGTSGFTNLSDTTVDSFGGEVDLRVFPVDGLDLLASAAVQRTYETSPAGRVVDGSSSLVKANLGGMYRSPFRTDFTVMGHLISAQAWRLREFDANGQVVVNVEDVPTRFLLSARVGVRPLKDRDLELSINLWNPQGFAEGFREHPKGQTVGARLFGAVAFTF